MNNPPESFNTIDSTDTTPLDEIIISSNDTYLESIFINNTAPAPNMLKMTAPTIAKSHTNRFVPWFCPDNELGQVAKLREKIFNDKPVEVLHTNHNDSHILAAANKLLNIQSEYLTFHYPEIYQLETAVSQGPRIINKLTEQVFNLSSEDQHPLEISGLLGQEDICVVQENRIGHYALVAGFLATPTEWSLNDFINSDMDAIHSNVLGYFTASKNRRLALKHTVDKSLKEMKAYPEGQFVRNNIFMKIDPALALFKYIKRMPHRETIIKDIGDNIFIRSERETLTRLPKPFDDFRIFTIKPHVFPISRIYNVHRNIELAGAIDSNVILQQPLNDWGLLNDVQNFLVQSNDNHS